MKPSVVGIHDLLIVRRVSRTIRIARWAWVWLLKRSQESLREDWDDSPLSRGFLSGPQADRPNGKREFFWQSLWQTFLGFLMDKYLEGQKL